MRKDIIKSQSAAKSLYKDLAAKYGEEAAIQRMAADLGESELVTAYYVGARTLEDAQKGSGASFLSGGDDSKVKRALLLDGIRAVVTREKREKKTSDFSIDASGSAIYSESGAILAACAEEIAECYGVVQSATAAWLRMGFALVRAKRVLRHGYFQLWRNATFPDFTKQHLSNAQRVAEMIIQTRQDNLESLHMAGWHDYVSEVVADYMGQSQRGLLMQAREYKQLSAGEEEHRDWVLLQFEARPEWEDEYMVRIESGELTWTQVYMALKGKTESVDANGKRNETPRWRALWKHVVTLPGSAKTLGKWDEIPAERQKDMLESIRELIRFIPPHLRKMVEPDDVTDVTAEPGLED